MAHSALRLDDPPFADTRNICLAVLPEPVGPWLTGNSRLGLWLPMTAETIEQMLASIDLEERLLGADLSVHDFRLVQEAGSFWG